MYIYICFWRTLFWPTLFRPTLFHPTLFWPSLFRPTLFRPTLFRPNLLRPTLFWPTLHLKCARRYTHMHVMFDGWSSWYRKCCIHTHAGKHACKHTAHTLTCKHTHIHTHTQHKAHTCIEMMPSFAPSSTFSSSSIAARPSGLTKRVALLLSSLEPMLVALT